MRITIALSFLAALCTIETVLAMDELDILLMQVKSMKRDVDTIVLQLELLSTDTKNDAFQDLSFKRGEEEDNYRRYKALLFSWIRNEIKTAETLGKNVNSCNEEASKSIESTEKVASDQAEKCEKNAQNSIGSNVDNLIDIVISTGKRLSAELSDVFMNCYDSDIYRMQGCIVRELARLEIDLNNLQSDSITVRVSVTPVTKNVITQASNCIKQAYAVTYVAGAATKLQLTQCIEGTTVPTPKTTETTTDTTTKSTTISTTISTTTPTTTTTTTTKKCLTKNSETCV